ncbi:carboxypeptidase-like regulatory domain-containing protein [Rubrivirga sp.]|uniref:DUF5686 and carboxypeptidase-like regulatory domain-containing protein n=1 Tax=Rubrivirga sp. TaxID=1885344 RepID=UPI003B51B6DD
MRLAPLALVLLALGAHAQTTVRGRVTDATTGDGLPAATVQVPGTSRGTITNAEGTFELTVPVGADSLVVRFVGYETARRAVPSSGRLDLALAPAVATLGEAVVTAGNPAETLMRRVIERKARWRAALDTWRAEVYTRQTIRAAGEVVGVIEAQTLAFWDRERGTREVVQGVNRTGNFDAVPLDLFTAADQTLNLYDDEVAFGGFDLMGPTSTDALGFYRFEIVGTRALGTDLVVDLSFEPRSALQPGFRGTLAVLVEADAMIAVSAGLSDAVQFPVVRQFEVRFDQQFSSFGLDVGGEPVWLPADFRMDASGRAGTALIRIPDIGFAVASRFTDYAANVAVPDSLFEREGAVVDSASVARALPVAGVVPLSAEEERALVDVDSTLSLTEAFRPTGPLARFFPVSISVAGASSGEPPRGLRFSRSFGARYNRVEGAVVNAFGTARLAGHSATLGVGYETGLEDVIASLGVVSRLSTEAFVGAEVHRDVATLGRTTWVDRRTNSLSALAFGEDYFDYVGRLGGWAWAGWWGQEAPFPHAQVWAALDEYDALPVTTEFSLTGDLSPATVATVPNGVARAGVQLRIGSWAEGPPLGLTGQRAASLWVEGGRRWDGLAPVEAREYGRVEGEVRWSQPTVLRRRLLPPTLHLRLAAGAATGPLPITRAFGIDGSLAGLSTFGSLRARSGLALVREYALVAWEHDFRSVPFELVGWRGAAPLGLSLQVHGAHAWGSGFDSAPRTEARLVHHEVGASLGLGFNVPLRLDVTYRLTDGPGVVVGAGIARLF